MTARVIDDPANTYEEENTVLCLALLLEKSPDLALVVKRREELPEAVGADIVAMIRASKL
ncbi:MAG: hypothetical protein JSU63_17925 [Phycisphaerales bacterium]|nr:MAG: hypothetical protein JSU63_17925 [Phycisphaerales bacterium]